MNEFDSEVSLNKKWIRCEQKTLYPIRKSEHRVHHVENAIPLIVYRLWAWTLNIERTIRKKKLLEIRFYVLYTEATVTTYNEKS